MIRDSNYITILAPMITKLKLKGNDLLIFALIHGFSQDGETRFKGSISYLRKWTGLNKSTIISILKKLVDSGYLDKFEYERNKVKYCEYLSKYFDCLTRLENATAPPVGKDDRPVVVKSDAPPVGKDDPILIDNNTTILDNNDTPQNAFASLFPDEQKVEETKDKKTLFRNSDVYKLVKFENGVAVDYSEFEKKFTGAEFERVDLVYYFHSVSDWSDQKNTKRTKNGWLATVRNFIRGDVEKKKLHLKPEYQTQKQKINVAGAMDYLKNDY